MNAKEVFNRLTPVQREQMARMKDEPMVWSRTHSWPSIRDALTIARCVQYVHALSSAEAWTQITDLGREVRTIAQEAEDAALLKDGNARYSDAQKAQF
jgi:hypothetical protein